MDSSAHRSRKGQLRNLKLVCLAEIRPAEPIKGAMWPLDNKSCPPLI